MLRSLTKAALKSVSTAGILVTLLSSVFFVIASCRPIDEKITHSPAQALSFYTGHTDTNGTAHNDTLVFDTVLTGVLSTTHRVIVYNNNSEAVLISSVILASGRGPYSFIVNGKQGPITDMTLRGNDSLLVLVTVTPDTTTSDQTLFIEDDLVFRTSGIADPQKIHLLTFGRNAHYFNGTTLPCDALWDDMKRPYVIYNSVLVSKGCTLTINEGIKVLNYSGSNIIVEGTLLVYGTKYQPVTFAGTRLEPDYDNLGGQWGGIYFLGGSKGNYLDHAVLKNGQRGLQADTPYSKLSVDVELHNCIIKNMSDVGIYSFGGSVSAYNTVVTDCGNFLVAGLQGGSYQFLHCTFAYSGTLGVIRKTPAVAFTDYYDVEGDNLPKVYGTRLDMDFINCIISGENSNEFILDRQNSSTPFTYYTPGNLVRTRNSTFNPDSNIITDYQIYSFRNRAQYDFRPDTTFEGRHKGRNLNNPALRPFRPYLVTDLYDSTRNMATPDIGAAE